MAHPLPLAPHAWRAPFRAPFRALFVLAGGLLSALAFAATPCRIAFDMGSSGIRAGASQSAVTSRADIDFLGVLLAGGGAQAFVAPTIAALRDLPEQAGFTAGCARVGGGFSAWRLAAQQDSRQLVAALTRIEAASGVAILLIPARQEGAYGYFAARQALGERLRTSHVLDIGGGSLQIAGERSSFVATLGQKAWHHMLCREIRQNTALPCALQPISDDELARARALLAEQLQSITTDLPNGATMTAISRPVSRGIAPAVRQLGGSADQRDGQLSRPAVSAAIAQLAPLTLAETMARTKAPGAHAAFLLSDLLLLEGLMRMTGDAELQVAEIDLTNLPGLLADERAFAWRERYACYLERLPELGPDAYLSDPETCR